MPNKKKEKKTKEKGDGGFYSKTPTPLFIFPPLPSLLAQNPKPQTLDPA